MKLKNDAIILLIPGFPADESDSSCLPAQQSLVLAINRLFPVLQVIIVSFQYPYSSGQYRWNNNLVIPLNGRNKSKAHRVLTWLRAWQTLSRLHKRTNIIGLFSCWLNETALIGHYFAKTKRYPHFTWLQGQDAIATNKYASWLRLDAQSLVAMSDFLADEFYKNHGVRPAHIITHGIDPDLYGPVAPVKDIDIMAAGSLNPLKQYAVFIKIIAAIQQQLPGLSVVLCGDGPEKAKLLSLIDEYGLGNTITLTGQTPHSEVLSLMQRSRLLLHTSSYEGFGGVCIEALYAGAHVISFTRPMNAWIRHWHIADNEKAMTALSLLLLQNPSLPHTPVLPYRMSDSAKAIVSLFDYNDAVIS